MTIAFVGAAGTGANNSSVSSFDLTTATNSFANGDFGILRVCTDNLATADGVTNDHVSVTGSNITATKLGEYTNTNGGAAGDGTCTSLWLLHMTGTVSIGSLITISLSGTSSGDKVAALTKFTKAANCSIRIAGGGSVQTGQFNATTTLPNLTPFGSASISRLWIRADGLEGNTTTAVTPTTNCTALASARSRNNASAVSIMGEYRIVAGFSQTMSPTSSVSGDGSSVAIGLEEYTSGSVDKTLGVLTSSGVGTLAIGNSSGGGTLGALTSTTPAGSLGITGSLGGGGGGGGGGGSTITLDPAAKNSHLTLSGGNLIATGAYGWGAQGARSTGTGQPDSQFEFTIDARPSGSGRLYVGICNSTPDLTVGGTMPGFTDNHGIILEFHFGIAAISVIRNTAGQFSTASGGGPAVGDTYTFRKSQTADTIDVWRRRSGTETQIVTGLAWSPDGFDYAFTVIEDDNTCTLNFGASAFQHPLDSGFTSFQGTSSSANLGDVTLVAAGTQVSEIQGSLSQTLGAVTSASNGAVAIGGSTGGTLAALTSAGTGTLAIEGTTAKTLVALTSTGSSTLGIDGSTSQTLGVLSVSGTGALAISGSTSQTLGAVTLVSTGAGDELAGTLNQTLGVLTSTTAATLTNQGAAAIVLVGASSASSSALGIGGTTSGVLAPVGLSSAASVGVTGSGSSTLANLTSVSAASLGVGGTTAKTLAALTGSSTGALALSGSAAGTFVDVTLVSAGQPGGSGALAQTLGLLTAASTSTLPIQGAVVRTIGPVTSLTGTELPILGSLAKTLGILTLSSAGSIPPNFGAADCALGGVSSVSNGALPIGAATAGALGELTASAVAVLELRGTASITLGQVTVFGYSGTLTEGTVAKTLGTLVANINTQLPIEGQGGGTLSPVSLMIRTQSQVYKATSGRPSTQAGNRPADLSGRRPSNLSGQRPSNVIRR